MANLLQFISDIGQFIVLVAIMVILSILAYGYIVGKSKERKEMEELVRQVEGQGNESE